MDKKRILWEIFNQSISDDGPHFMTTRSGPAVVVSMNGDTKDLTFLLVTAMEKDDRIADVFKHAIMIHELDGMNIPDIIKELLNFTPGDCDTCPIEDVCDIKDGVKKECDPVLEKMRDLIKQKKGDK